MSVSLDRIARIHDEMLRQLGPEWPHWLPETLWAECTRAMLPGGSGDLVERNILQAMALALSTNLPWVERVAFEKCAIAWAGVIPDPEIFEVPEPWEALRACRLLKMFRKEETFGDDIGVFVAGLFFEAGMIHVGLDPILAELRVQELLENKFLGHHPAYAGLFIKIDNILRMPEKDAHKLIDSAPSTDVASAQARRILRTYELCTA